jgi:hypothetical protein
MNAIRIGSDQVGRLWLSTILPIGYGKFESMIFQREPGTNDVDWTTLYVEYYDTEEEARAGHLRILDRLQSGWNPLEELPGMKHGY